jgi:hypothetical protein
MSALAISKRLFLAGALAAGALAAGALAAGALAAGALAAGALAAGACVGSESEPQPADTKSTHRIIAIEMILEPFPIAFDNDMAYSLLKLQVSDDTVTRYVVLEPPL